MVSKTDETEESDKPIKKSDIDQLITAIPGRQVSQKLEERWSEAVEAGKNINCPCKVTISGPSGCEVYRFFIVVGCPVMYVLTLYSNKYWLFIFYMCKGKQNRKEETFTSRCHGNEFLDRNEPWSCKDSRKKKRKQIDFFDFPENDCSLGTKR